MQCCKSVINLLRFLWQIFRTPFFRFNSSDIDCHFVAMLYTRSRFTFISPAFKSSTQTALGPRYLFFAKPTLPFLNTSVLTTWRQGLNVIFPLDLHNLHLQPISRSFISHTTIILYRSTLNDSRFLLIVDSLLTWKMHMLQRPFLE